jgi:hypothetical protein
VVVMVFLVGWTACGGMGGFDGATAQKRSADWSARSIRRVRDSSLFSVLIEGRQAGRQG